MDKLVCVKCEKELKPYKSGAYLVEMFQSNSEIYKIWQCDIWQCPVCKVKIVSGYGGNPIRQHFDLDCKQYLETIKTDGATIVYNYEILEGKKK